MAAQLLPERRASPAVAAAPPAVAREAAPQPAPAPDAEPKPYLPTSTALSLIHI